MLWAVALVGLGALIHLALGRWVGSPWLVPDVLLVSVVLAMTRRPERTWMPACLGGVLAMLLTPHHPVLIGVAYVGAGSLSRVLATTWDLTAESLQRAAVVVGEALVLLAGLLASSTVSAGLIASSGVRLLMTLALLSVAQSLVGTQRQIG